ncbi:hypothetical protein IFM89_037851 [Coptis chinensis]|uniref:30S ribosomal protein S9, chloroplastic n=1 Tax=Coptis chinensis TaxID=261450 RepID=A0A835HQ96_9MAGN|nr:hypothetical protein IFM89_037851 [Coptis chinensis]
MKGWSIGDDDKVNDIFNIGGEEGGIDGIEDLSSEVEDNRNAKNEVQQELEMEKKQLLLQLKGPNRAFGDLIAAAGITDAMLDSLIALKDLEGVEGLSPLSEIEDTNSEKSQKSYTRAEIERRKQEEIDKSRVRRVDEKGRAYGTGRRKCSVARVWIEPGEGKFIVNDKQFDVYFPIIDHRADLLRPFCETKTLGLWDVKCTVKGGGVSGQVGAVRLGISRALQNWEPGLRSDLKADWENLYNAIPSSKPLWLVHLFKALGLHACSDLVTTKYRAPGLISITIGFLTRDPRMVERKKPGKAKARKSFQWVKR